MRDAARRGMQAILLWTVVGAVLVWLWPPIIRLPQPWILLGVSVLANVLQPSYTPFDGSRTQEDHGTFTQIIWTVYLTQLAALVEMVIRKPGDLTFGVVSAVVVGVMVVGLALRTWAIVVLGRCFTLQIDVQPGQPVIQTGPYRVIRHPSYAGALLTFVASGALLHSWLAAGLAVVVLPAAFWRRIRHEERALRATVPGYREYAARTGAMMPRLSSRRS